MKCSDITLDAGEPRPLCRQHNLPMTRKDKQAHGRQRWRCSVEKSEMNARRIRVLNIYVGSRPY